MKPMSEYEGIAGIIEAAKAPDTLQKRCFLIAVTFLN